MNTTQARSRWRMTYDRWLGPALVIFCCVAVVVCSVAVAIEAHTNRVQDAQRLKDQKDRTAVIAHVTTCIRDFAAELGENLPPVRTASAQRDAALDSALAHLESVLAETVMAKVTKHDVVELVNALERYQAVSNHLKKVRIANPYPKIPAARCQL